MSKSSYAETDDKTLADDPNAPSGEVDFNKRYTTRANEPMPVMGDTKPVEDPVEPEMGDTEQGLRRDEAETMDRSNIMKDRTRHANPRRNYQEGADESLGLNYREE